MFDEFLLQPAGRSIYHRFFKNSQTKLKKKIKYGDACENIRKVVREPARVPLGSNG